jgi:hypothetical protein
MIPDRFKLTIEQASAQGLCKLCNYAGRGKYEHKPCDYHRVLNWLNVPAGMCALTEDDIARKREDMALGRQ